MSELHSSDGSTVGLNGGTRSAEVRAHLDHPVIDADGHFVEFMPLLLDYLREEGGQRVVSRFDVSEAAGPAGEKSLRRHWYDLNEQQRLDQRIARPPWWVLPTCRALDNATVMLPRLFQNRMEEIGIDFAVLYPTRGIPVVSIPDQEVRLAACRALNRYVADVFGGYQTLTPVAVIPMHTPEEAIAELDHAVLGLGLRSVMLASHVVRPLGAFAAGRPALESPTYVDNLCLDSGADYDPVWARCLELKVSPAFHSGSVGWGSRTSPTNYVYNHIGHFAASSEALCKAMFVGGVTRRFPELRFAFLEGGVGWATNLFCDLVGHWEKRNGSAIANYDPENFDEEAFTRLFHLYADDRMQTKSDMVADVLARLRQDPVDRCRLDDFEAVGAERVEDVRDRFVPSFYFGCEADDPTNVLAFDTRIQPFGAQLNAMFGSDIGHWDVPDIRHVLAEAHEAVDNGLMRAGDFRDFVFGNAVRFFTAVNPEYFVGTAVEAPVSELLGSVSAL